MGTLTTLNEVKRALAVSSNVNGTVTFDKNLDDTLLNDLIVQASDLFSQETGQNYYAAPGTLTRHVTRQYVRGRKLFFREDVLSITRIENDGNDHDGTLTAADWVTMPLEASGPYYGVELKESYWSWTDNQLGAIRVIGTIGRSLSGQPPARVGLAVTRLTSWLYQTRDTRGSVRFADRTVNFPQDAPTLVLDIIEQEKIHRSYT